MGPVDAPLLLLLLRPAARLQNIQRRGAVAMRKSCVAVAHDRPEQELDTCTSPPH